MDTNKAFLKRAIFGGEKVEAAKLLNSLKSNYKYLVQDAPGTQYRILRLDMRDGDWDKEFLVHFFDTTGAGFQLVILLDSLNNQFYYKGSALVGLEGFWDNSMPIIDSASATIWLKCGKMGMNAPQFNYHIYKMKDTLELVTSFPGYSLIREQFENYSAFYTAKFSYEVNPVYSCVTQYVQLQHEVYKDGRLKKEIMLFKQNLLLEYLGNFTKGFSCIDLYGDTLETPIDAKDFYELYNKGRIAECTKVCPKEKKTENIGSVISYNLKLKNHLVETSQHYYGQDSSGETTVYLYKDKTISVDGNLFNLEKWHQKQFSQPLYNGSYLSDCIELYEYIDHAEIHIRLYNTGCCCGFCADYLIANIQLYKNGKSKVDFFNNPINEYWQNW